jgi:hypothetical protein
MIAVIALILALSIALGFVAILEECAKAEPKGLTVTALIVLCAIAGGALGGLLEGLLP